MVRLKYFLPVFIVVFALDQYTKWWFVERYFGSATQGKGFYEWFVSFGQERNPFDLVEITDFLNFVVVWNQGVSFGLFSNDSQMNVYFLSAIALLICGFFFYLFTQKNNMAQHTAIAMITAGALGNIWDRLRFGAVFDFIDIHYSGWHYPAFNVADSAISIGVLLYIFIELFSRERESNPLAKKVGRWHDD